MPISREEQALRTCQDTIQKKGATDPGFAIAYALLRVADELDRQATAAEDIAGCLQAIVKGGIKVRM
jgi:hypothetical protein